MESTNGIELKKKKKLIVVSNQTLIRWDQSGKLKAIHLISQ